MNNLNLDWNNLGFDYRQTSKRYVSNYENNSWDEGNLTEDANVVINECARECFNMHKLVLKG